MLPGFTDEFSSRAGLSCDDLRSDERKGNHVRWIRWAILSTDHVAMEPVRLDAIVYCNRAVRQRFGGRCTNSVTGQVIMFGGLADVNPINTWTYDGSTWTLQSPRFQLPWVYAASAVYDPLLSCVVLFGGSNGGIDQDSTWKWYGFISDWRPFVSAPTAATT